MKRLRQPNWKQLGINAAGFLVISTTAVTSLGATGATLMGGAPDDDALFDSVRTLIQGINDTGNHECPVVAYCNQPLADSTMCLL